MQTFQQEQPLDFENLMERQRQLMKEMTSLSSKVNKSKSDNNDKANSAADTATEESSSQAVSHDDASAASSEKEEEWISNWQFERVPSTKKLMTTTAQESKTTTTVVVVDNVNVVSPSPAPSPAATSSSRSSNNNNTTTTTTSEGGVFYFERILPAATDVTVSTASSNDAPHRISSSSSSSPNYDLDNLTVEYDNNIGDDDDDDMLFDMAIDNDDLFADLESAAVVGTDDSEISLDDLMDMDVTAIDNNHNNKSKNTALNVNNEDHHISKNDDMMMDDVEDNEDNEGGDDHRFYYTSPIACNVGSSGPSTPPQPLKTFSYHNSPTSTIMPPPLVVGSNSSLRSATTRPALSEMRKIMNNFMNEDSNMNDTASTTPSSLQLQQSQSRLPCARGMDGMYLDTLHKLHESMKRSKRTRQSLSMSTQHTQEYERNMCVSQIVQSVQNSSQQVDTCLQSVVVGMR